MNLEKMDRAIDALENLLESKAVILPKEMTHSPSRQSEDQLASAVEHIAKALYFAHAVRGFKSEAKNIEIIKE